MKMWMRRLGTSPSSGSLKVKMNYAVCSVLLYATWCNTMNTHWSLVHA